MLGFIQGIHKTTTAPQDPESQGSSWERTALVVSEVFRQWTHSCLSKGVSEGPVALAQGAQVWEGSPGRHTSLPPKFTLTIWVALHWGHHTASQVNRSQGIFPLKEKRVLHYVSKVKYSSILDPLGAKATYAHCGLEKSGRRLKGTCSGSSTPLPTSHSREAGRTGRRKSTWAHVWRKVAAGAGREAEPSHPAGEWPGVSRVLRPQVTDIVVEPSWGESREPCRSWGPNPDRYDSTY